MLNKHKALLSRQFLKSWKTTLAGIVISFAGFVSFSPDYFGGEHSFFVLVCKYVAAGGFAALGLAAKDFNVNVVTNKD